MFLRNKRPVSLRDKIMYVAVETVTDGKLRHGLKGSKEKPIILFCEQSSEIFQLEMKKYDIYEATSLGSSYAIPLTGNKKDKWQDGYLIQDKIGFTADIPLRKLKYISTVNRRL